jgi:hypothetical protein
MKGNTMKKTTLILAFLVLAVYPLLMGTLFFSNSSGSNSIGVGQMRTATGSGVGTSLSVTMNDYSFFPALTTTGASNHNVASVNIADPVDTIGRIRDFSGTDTQTFRWRYITASDQPRIWVAYDAVTGTIGGVWVSDDPCTPDDATPCLSRPGMVTKKFLSADLTAPTFSGSDLTKAQAYIGNRGYGASQMAYRQLQQKANDVAPALWIFTNMKVNVSNGTLTCQSVC